MDATEILNATADRDERTLADGEVLLQEGVRSGALFVLVSGALEVRRGGVPVVVIADSGAVVGELGLLLDSPASADVVAVGTTVVREVADVEDFFVRYPEFARYLATVLARRLWQISTYLSDLKAQFADRDDIFGLMPEVLQELLGSARPEPEPGSEREPDAPY